MLNFHNKTEVYRLYQIVTYEEMRLRQMNMPFYFYSTSGVHKCKIDLIVSVNLMHFSILESSIDEGSNGSLLYINLCLQFLWFVFFCMDKSFIKGIMSI